MSLSYDHAAEVNANIIGTLRAENARLQTALEGAERERDWWMRMPLDERIDALVAKLDGAEALAKLRGDVLADTKPGRQRWEKRRRAAIDATPASAREKEKKR